MYFSVNPKPLAPKDEQAIRLWLAFIGEENPDEISKVLVKCQTDPKALTPARENGSYPFNDALPDFLTVRDDTAMYNAGMLKQVRLNETRAGNDRKR